MNIYEIQPQEKPECNGSSIPRLTPEDVDTMVLGVDYSVFLDASVTVCCLKLRDKFAVVGYSVARNAEDVDTKIEREAAKQNAYENLWNLVGDE